FLTKKQYPDAEAERKELFQDFNLPQLLFSETTYKCNGFAGSDGVYNSSGGLISFISWFRCLVKMVGDGSKGYTWHEMTFFTHWTPDRSIIICVDTPSDMQSKLFATLSTNSSIDFSDPFSLYGPLFDEIVKLYDSSIWRIRDVIRTHEKQILQDETGFSGLHDIMRHAIHSSEVLAVTGGSLRSFRHQREELFRQTHLTANTSNNKSLKHMQFQTQMIENLKLRSDANKERLQNELALAYNLITQRDSKVLTGIGESTRSDSAAMRTVALVTMAFLPATFICAIFGMSFFDFAPGDGVEPAKWTVSDQFWIYWVVAIPVTAATISVWYIWQHGLPHRMAVILTNRFNRRGLSSGTVSKV
ncbi:hypothetical protein K402DRAFT_326306, partial [Aulographum hederae CBS 113979]